jgi:hypothetical protein
MGHEDSVVSTFMACGCVALFLYNYYKGATSGEKIDLNNVELFTVNDMDVSQVTVQETKKSKPTNTKNTTKTKSHHPKKQAKRNPARQVTPKKTKVKPEPVRNHNGYTELQQDCFDALKSLGIKAVKERKFIISSTFNNHNPDTIQDFLKLALGK